ncbi:MAG: HAMP domain-containing sensor histidine kinase [Rhizomicrobium sp.]
MERKNGIQKFWSPGILHTQAFRIVLAYLLFFALSATVLVGFTYWYTTRALNDQTDQTIRAEIIGLSDQYQRQGVRGLADVIINRSMHNGLGLYLLADGRGLPVAGNLDEMPVRMLDRDGFIEFDYERHIQSSLVRRRARGQVYALIGGNYRLLVARDVTDQRLMRKQFSMTLPWIIGLILLFGSIGGALVSRKTLKRLDTINHTSGEIIAGDFSRRVPVTDAGDEFDALAENLNRMLDRTERLMKGMREVVDSVAHDLRTPLTRLRNRLEEAQKHVDPDSAFAADIDGAIGETDRLISTFNALLLIAEADAGAARGTMSPLDLSTVVPDMVELYEPLAEEKNLSLTALPSGVAVIEANRRLISQALANLIDNAIKYTPAGGAIVVSLAETPQGIDLTVADNGPGIADADRERVLQRFVRLEKSRNSPGTGLGLSLVDAVARLHEARLMLADNKPGLKATICFPRPAPRPGKVPPPVLPPIV